MSSESLTSKSTPLISDEAAAQPHSTPSGPSAAASSFVRLGSLWLSAVICGGVTPGAALFSHLFAEAGLFAEVCSHDLCKTQYLLISSILFCLQGLTSCVLLPGGMFFDSVGGRLSGVIGAVVVGIGVLLLIGSVSSSSGLLFVFAVVVTNIGSIIHNLAFFALVWHLPNWQTLLLALSFACIQVSAILPVLLRAAMTAWGLSLVDALSGYAVLVVMGGILCWYAVPTQSEYYRQAQYMLGVPVQPRPPQFNASAIRSALYMDCRVLAENRVENVFLATICVLGSVTMTVYSSLAVPFGRALFHGDKGSGEALAIIYTQFASLVGLVAVPLVGKFVDAIGLAGMATCNSICVLVTFVFCSSATWNAQYACALSTACYNAWNLMTMKYILGLAPPQRLGSVQGLFLALVMVAMGPFYVLYAIVVGSFGGIDAFVVPARLIGLPALLGWVLYTLRLWTWPLPQMVLLKEDEEELMSEMFKLSSLEDAEQVLALDRKEILRRLASLDVVEARGIIELTNDPEVRARWLALAKSRGEMPTPTGLESVFSCLYDFSSCASCAVNWVPGSHR